MSRSQNTPLLLALLTCIFLVAGAIVAALLIAGQRPVVVVLPPGGSMPAAEPAAPAPGGTGTAGPVGAAPAPKPPEVIVARLPAVPACDSVLDAAWSGVPTVDIPLQPQQNAVPMLEAATISSITVQAAHDGKRIAWRLSWAAAQPSTGTETGRFPDAVAVQFPMVDGASFMMGGKGQPVRVLHWKALWQEDIDKGFQDIDSVYPQAWNDLYWFATGPAPYRLKDAFANPFSRQWLIPYSAGNPMADFERRETIEEIVAEGFGTVTHVPQTPSRARGVWKDRRWTVVIDRPVDPAEPLIARLQGQGNLAMSFAVWDGSAGNRGGRKHYCNWVPLRVEP